MAASEFIARHATEMRNMGIVAISGYFPAITRRNHLAPARILSVRDVLPGRFDEYFSV